MRWLANKLRGEHRRTPSLSEHYLVSRPWFARNGRQLLGNLHVVEMRERVVRVAVQSYIGQKGEPLAALYQDALGARPVTIDDRTAFADDSAA